MHGPWLNHICCAWPHQRCHAHACWRTCGRIRVGVPARAAMAVLLLQAGLGAVALAGTPMQRVLLDRSKAIDGTPALYYGDRNVSSTKYVIWLEGGGICQSLADCIGRANSALGSSKSFPQTFEIGQPMMQVLSCSVRCCRARPLDMTSPRCGHAERLPCQSWVLRVEPRLPTLRLGRHLDRNGPGTTQSVPSNSFGLGGGRSVDGVSQFSLIFSSLCPRNETEL
jgi:hypothetical protein